MELTKKELVLLCQINKNSTLEGININDLLSPKDSVEAMEGLAKKGIVENGKITESGLTTLKCIDRYSKSKLFLRMGTITMARTVNNQLISIAEVLGNFHILVTSKEEAILSVMSKLPDIDKIGDKESQTISVSKKEFQKTLDEMSDFKGQFYLKIDKTNNIQHSGVLYVNDGYLNDYDVTTQALNRYSKEGVQGVVEGLFETEVLMS